MRHPSTARGPATFTRSIVVELATFPDRMDRALETMADARSPLKGNGCGTIPNDAASQPPPGITITEHGVYSEAAQADHARRDLIRTINTISGLVRHVGAILNEWAPQPAKPGTTIWCENHLRYGHQTPRSSDGSTSCDWCANVHRNYGAWPNRQLVDRHDRGYRISATEFQRALGKKGVA